MPRDPLAYTFTGSTNPNGTAAEFIPGLPSRDIHRSEFDGMTDFEKAALHASPLHRAYGKADEESEAAAERAGLGDAVMVDNSPIAAMPITEVTATVDDATASPRGKR